MKPDISYLYNEIIEKANPKMFIDPYQPNKLAIANEIYSKALKNRYNRDVLEELLNRINHNPLANMEGLICEMQSGPPFYF